MTTDQLQSVHIDTVEQGRKYLTQIESKRADLFIKMLEVDNNAEHKALVDEDYELLKAKRRIQSIMTKIAGML